MVAPQKVSKTPKRKIMCFNRKEILRKIRQIQKEDHVRQTPSRMERYRLNDIRRFIGDFFLNPENQKEVYRHTIWTPKRSYEVVAIKSKGQIIVIIYTDGKVSEMIALNP